MKKKPGHYFTYMVLCIILYFHIPFFLSGQRGFSFIRNYSREEYGQQSQNWSVAQDRRGVIYVANNGGVLEYDGVDWRRIRVPHSYVYSLAVDESGRIFVGGKDEFGYLDPDEKGELKYISLLPHLDKPLTDSFKVRKLYAAADGVYFRSIPYLIRRHKDRLTMVDPAPGKKFNASFLCDGKLYIRQNKAGLCRVRRDRLEPLPGGEAFSKKKIFMMAAYDSRRLLIGTEKNGFYLYDFNTAVPFFTQADDYVAKNQLSHGIRLSPHSAPTAEFALATKQGGLLIIDSRGRLKHIFNEASGLQDNNIKHVFRDTLGNLWLSLARGVSRIEYPSPFSIYDKRSNLHGLVLSVARHRTGNRLYAGTTDGVYVLAHDDGKTTVQGALPRFLPVPGIGSYCNALLPLVDGILAATTSGVFLVNDKEVTRLIAVPAYSLKRSNRDANRFWIGTRKGVLSVKREKGGWSAPLEIKGINTKISSIQEEVGEESLWLGTITQGVYKVEFPGGALDTPRVKSFFGPTHGLPEVDIHVSRAAGHVVFATRRGIFRFDAAASKFTGDAAWGPEFEGSKDGATVFRMIEDRSRHIWFHSNWRNFQAVPRPDGSFHIIKEPFSRFPPFQVNAIYPDPSHGKDVVWFATNDGLIRYDKTINIPPRHTYPVLIRKVAVDGSPVFEGVVNGMNASHIPAFEANVRHLQFEFAAPTYLDDSTVIFKCFLEGIDKKWSPWDRSARKDYTNLDAGLYTFRVEAKDNYENMSPEALFKFRVLPPWYRAWWAILSYVLIFLLLTFLMIKWWRSYQLEHEKRKLERIVKERTREINDKKLQLERQAEKLKDMDKVKSRFFANISHEFRTPLTLIMGPLEQMIAGSPDKNQQRQYHLMLKNSQRLLGLINQLLELAKIESGKIQPRVSPQNVISFLKGLTASFEPAAAKNELELIFHSEADQVTLYYDPEKLEEVFFNLLSNAVKFTPANGRITVTAALLPPETGKTKDPGWVEVSVSDTGPGIPREQLVNIFDRFYQAGGAFEFHGKGSGIGLSIAREMVQLHHGEISVHSEEGKGTRFVIRLPMGKNHFKPGQIVQTRAPGAPRSSPGLTPEPGPANEEPLPKEECSSPGDNDSLNREKDIILVIEDSPDLTRYISDSLSSQYTVATAANGREGIDKALEIIPDLIISDIMMPEIDGYEVCRRLKNNVPTSHIPIILLTARASEEDVVKGLRTGADDYITKPFNTKILAIRIQNLIDLRLQVQRAMYREMSMQPVKIDVSPIDKSFIKRLKQVLKENISDPDFNIDQLCKTISLSQPTLYRKIRALTGESPTGFIRSYRLKRGAELLKKGGMSIVEVALETGFSSAGYFTKCFKEKFHQLPSTYQASEGE
jgi:signal transduction histidine kinase/DNA-binding NarL/FixJ family response regulator